MFRPYSGVVETSGDRVTLDGLTILVLKHVTSCSVKHAWLSEVQSGCVTIGIHTFTAGFKSKYFHIFIIQKRVEEANRI
jgi:hypothetical protein